MGETSAFDSKTHIIFTRYPLHKLFCFNILKIPDTSRLGLWKAMRSVVSLQMNARLFK